jgi:hypothetical protein
MARSELWSLSTLKRVRDCGRSPVMPGGSVALRLTAGAAGFAGLASCGSVWADPVCNAKIMARRALEIGAAVATWQATGGSVAFVTLTMRHRRGQPLAALWGALSYAWGRVTSGSSWKRDAAAHGVEGWLRVVEVTHGPNGWHVHVHALLFLAPAEPLGGYNLDGLHRSMFGRWSSALRARGLARPLMVGQDARLLDSAADADLARYFTKSVHGGHRIALELTASQTKHARAIHGTRPAWALLDDVVDLGDADALDLWHEWERGSKGRRQITWAQGLRQRLGLLADEQSDEQIAAEELGTADDELVLIDGAGWSQLVAAPALIPLLLDTAERGGLTAVLRFLNSHSITYTALTQERVA